MKSRPSEPILIAGIALAIGAVFSLDLVVTPEDVSVALIYAGPMFATVLSRRLNPYIVAAVTTALSLIGIVTAPDNAGVAFYGNRAVAIAIQWLIAALVMSHRRGEALRQEQLTTAIEKAGQQKRFLEIVSHEIGTSLTTIEGHAYRLMRPNAQIEEREIAERGGKMRKAVRHMQALIQRLQLVGEVEGQILQPGKDATALAPLLYDLCEAVQTSFPSVRIEMDIKGLPTTIVADTFMLHQVIENIVSNAAKYSRENGVVHIAGASLGPLAVIRVTDEGRGIPARDIPHVYDVYFRAGNSHDVRGSGVGLYIAKRFAEAMGGRLEITSEVGEGTTVSLFMPVGDPELRQ